VNSSTRKILPSKAPFAIAIIAILTIAIIACNPFAPGITDNTGQEEILKDQRTVSGLFDNFRYSYKNKDTLVYGNLLADDFTFSYFDNGLPLSWGREQDMRSTFGMFQAAQSLDVIWDDVYKEFGDTLLKDITRGFYLNIVFSPTDVIYLNGRATFRLKRASTQEVWRISQWWDEVSK
jgi:hypothetical protein